ncbi:uncharacterized protein BDZ99DRAFT_392026 [Mytilinidion resinicola]|uniref:Uncharacterized protein n=1 Tax=Mytilinidion resinicola TaxID=574789 RepID=A0A6A6YG84_9PEZI|nr:uncharacterized protein BDZ99DRAFT_392026 [Mytilinidion resinicola]KAF2807826.1 hypothetical protein BDZ99DRAFT_392026 [Mytilinidion resinicola]
MLAGPPRLLSVVSVAVVLLLGWWYISLVHTTSSTPLKTDHSPPPKSPKKNTGFRASVDPLDFSIPLIFTPGTPKPAGSNYSRILVLPKTKDEDIHWIHAELPEIPLAVYQVDNDTAEYRVPKNKGREAMVYLTYLIDHYNDLPDTIMFFHSHRYAWHNNILMGLDTAQAIRRLNDARVARLGYMNTRCHTDPGCPDWIHMDRPVVDFDDFHKPEEKYYRKGVWDELHPGAPVPPSLSAPCCAQFAVSRERVQQVPIERFVHYRKWLLETSMDDQFSGRVFEYIWQYIFTGNAVYCPAVSSCYCDGYGICFGSEKKTQHWFEVMDERNKLFEELNGHNKEKDKAAEEGRAFEFTEEVKARMKELEDKIRAMDAEMNQSRDAAYERGKVLKNQEAERETYDDTHIWDKVEQR